MVWPLQVNAKSVNSPFSRNLSSELDFIVFRRPEVCMYFAICSEVRVEIITVWLEVIVSSTKQIPIVREGQTTDGNPGQHCSRWWSINITPSFHD
jgi:hypothetical protein